MNFIQKFILNIGIKKITKNREVSNMFDKLQSNLAGKKTSYAQQQRIGLGIVVKVSKVQELLDYAFTECEKKLGR